MRPEMIPTNWFTILSKAGSASLPVIPATVPLLRRVVIMYMDTRPASAAAPSLSSAMPTATPMANSHDMLSISAPPALMRNRPAEYMNPPAVKP